MKTAVVIAILCCFQIKAQQIGNYVANGSFEDIVKGLSFPNYNAAKSWGPLDTNKYAYHVYSTSSSFSIPLAPHISTGFQYPRTGENLILTSFYCDPSACTYTWSRGYPRNRLKQTLKPNKVYCATYYVVNTNNSTLAMDSYAAYFGDSDLDTIKYCVMPLTYLNPQVENTTGIITDTLRWIPITGTFVANGTEKYMVLGNFKSNALTSTMVINPNSLPALGVDLYVDDVSLVEVDLPAYAGPDISVAPGYSVYIGRELDFAIDPGCVWFKLPEMTPIDTASGTWVQPTVTTTYVVRQILDCSSEKWDTVVVHMDLVGLEEMNLLKEHLQIYPIPARDYIEVSCSDRALLREIESAAIYNNLGQKLREETFMDESFKIKIEDLSPGSYSLYIKDHGGATLSKRFVVSP